MSPCTKRLQRSTRSFAPFSGLNAGACACTAPVKRAVPVPIVAAAATPALPSRNFRRLSSLIDVSWSGGEKGNAVLGREPPAGAGVEQVRAARIGLQVDDGAGLEVVALAEHDRDLGALV